MHPAVAASDEEDFKLHKERLVEALLKEDFAMMDD
jgi:hypothetical protein